MFVTFDDKRWAHKTYEIHVISMYVCRIHNNVVLYKLLYTVVYSSFSHISQDKNAK